MLTGRDGEEGCDVRRLAAVMLTDIVGYTALSQENEEGTQTLLKEHVRAVTPLFEAYGGRVVKSTGDGLLAVFASAVEATRCAIAIQGRHTEERETLRLRIGIHVGDIICRRGDIFGDGVNVAARIEPLAEPEGICISRQVYDQVWNKVDAVFESLGPKALKNLRLPLELFRVVTKPLSPTEPKKEDAPQDRIAVLPLLNISPDAADAYFADGLTEELIFTLSRLEGLRVIAQTTIMKYRDTRQSICEIGHELSVGSVLEGSVRKAGDRLRITLQLIDTASEEYLWSDVYNGNLGDIFALQADVAGRVADALQKTLHIQTRNQIENASANPAAYTLYLRGRTYLAHRTPQALHEAIQCLEQASQLDPTYAPAFAALAEAYVIMEERTRRPQREMRAKARALAIRAIELDERSPLAHAVLGMVYAYEVRWEDIECEYRVALSLDPSCVRAHHWLGYHLAFLERFPEAIAELQTAISLDPLSHTLHATLGLVRFFAGQDAEALQELSLSTELYPEDGLAREYSGWVHLLAGRHKEALACFQSAASALGDADASLVLGMSVARFRLGDAEALERGLASVLERAKESHVSPYIIGRFYLFLDRPDEAFRWFEKASEEGPSWDTAPVLNDFRQFHPAYQSDPRYIALLRKARFPKSVSPEEDRIETDPDLPLN